MPAVALLRLLEDMKAQGFAPTAYAFGPIMMALRKEGDLPRMRSAFQQLKADGESPSLCCGL